MSRGKLIAFEGLDKVGKTTQALMLNEKLQNSTMMRFPNRQSITGKQIDQYLKGNQKLPDQAIHLLFSANRWEEKKTILDCLNIGQNVILDRYIHSGAAYSAAKGLDLNWCLNSDKGLPKPDLIFYIEIDSEVAKQRAGYGNEIYEKESFQKNVEKYYKKIKDKEWILLDGSQSIEIIHKQIFQIVQSFEIQNKEIFEI